MNYYCPVCGYDRLEEPPYSPSGAGLYEICPSCGFQFGVTDDNEGISFHEWREVWLERGSPWFSSGTAPKDWDPKKQLRNLQRLANNTFNEELIDPAKSKE